MPAIKKTTASKTTKSPAPATKSARTPAPKSAPTKAKPAKSTKAKSAVVTPTQMAVAALATVTPPKSVVSVSVTTTIAASIDVGFGNTLYIRGEGPGLSWDAGVPLDCLGSAQWQIVLGESARPYSFKFLINDLTWSAGPDYTVSSGTSVTLTPQF